MSHLSTYDQEKIAYQQRMKEEAEEFHRARQLYHSQLAARQLVDEARYVQIQRDRYNGTYEQYRPFPMEVEQSHDVAHDGYNHNTLEQERANWRYNKGIWEAKQREFLAATNSRMPRYGYGFQ